MANPVTTLGALPAAMAKAIVDALDKLITSKKRSPGGRPIRPPARGRGGILRTRTFSDSKREIQASRARPDVYGARSNLLGELGTLPGLGILGKVSRGMNKARSTAEAYRKYKMASRGAKHRPKVKYPLTAVPKNPFGTGSPTHGPGMPGPFGRKAAGKPASPGPFGKGTGMPGSMRFYKTAGIPGSPQKPFGGSAVPGPFGTNTGAAGSPGPFGRGNTPPVSPGLPAPTPGTNEFAATTTDLSEDIKDLNETIKSLNDNLKQGDNGLPGNGSPEAKKIEAKPPTISKPQGPTSGQKSLSEKTADAMAVIKNVATLVAG